MAQQTLSVTDTPSAVAAVQTANGQSGDTLQLANSVTLTQVLPEVTSPVTFDSNGFTLTAEGSGALVTTSAATLSFIGAGTFSGPSGGVVETTTSGAALTNAASLTAQTNDAAAVDFSAPGTLNNSGSITGPVGAFWYSTGAVANTGSITATTSLAVEILGSDTTMSTVTNSGDLTGASYGVGVSGIGTVTNTGVITSPVFGIVLDRDGNSTGLSVVNNNAGGAISGQEAIYLLGATATVNNAANASINGTQIAIYATHGAVIANAGTISSPSGGSDAIDVSGGGSLTNSGSISSAAPAVTFGAAATISNNAGGSITGAQGGVVLYSGGR